jgi:Sec-independent protein translocase protein TatA
MLSIPDMAIAAAAALLLFGPEQLPKVARKAGQVVRDIQNTSQSFIREMERAADAADLEPPKVAAVPASVPQPVSVPVPDPHPPVTISGESTPTP